MDLQQEAKRRELYARLQELKARPRRGDSRMIRGGLVAMLLLPLAFGYYAVALTFDALRAVTGAEHIHGTVQSVEARAVSDEDDGTTTSGTGTVIVVAFPDARGVRAHRPVQHGGATDDDVTFSGDLIDLDTYRPGTVVDLLYHPELDDRIWLDDFRALWLLPLILVAVTLAAGFLTVGGLIVLWPDIGHDLHMTRLTQNRR